MGSWGRSGRLGNGVRSWPAPVLSKVQPWRFLRSAKSCESLRTLKPLKMDMLMSPSARAYSEAKARWIVRIKEVSNGFV